MSEKITIAIVLTKALDDKVAADAEEQTISKSAVIRLILMAHYQEKDKVEQATSG